MIKFDWNKPVTYKAVCIYTAACTAVSLVGYGIMYLTFFRPADKAEKEAKRTLKEADRVLNEDPFKL